MILLVSGSTRTVSRLASRWPQRLGHLLTPGNRNSVDSLLQTGLPWAADNGAYSGFEPERFRAFLARVTNQPRCLWVVCPDVVADAVSTLDLFHGWLPHVRATGQPVAFVGQDGAEDLDLPWDDFACLFLGGSTAWKLSSHAAGLAQEAKRQGKWVHMGRASSLRRFTVAFDMGCDSVDSSAASRFGDKYIHQFCAWLERIHTQPTLFGEED